MVSVLFLFLFLYPFAGGDLAGMGCLLLLGLLLGGEVAMNTAVALEDAAALGAAEVLVLGDAAVLRGAAAAVLGDAVVLEDAVLGTAAWPACAVAASLRSQGLGGLGAPLGAAVAPNWRLGGWLDVVLRLSVLLVDHRVLLVDQGLLVDHMVERILLLPTSAPALLSHAVICHVLAGGSRGPRCLAMPWLVAVYSRLAAAFPRLLRQLLASRCSRSSR